MKLPYALALVLASSACASTGNTSTDASLGDAAGAPTLVGSWHIARDVASGSAFDSQLTTYTFGADHAFRRLQVIHYNNTLADVAGCTQTLEYTGARWSTDSDGGAMTITISAGGAQTNVQTGCQDPANNRTAPPDSDFMLSGTYAFQGGSLVLTLNGFEEILTRD